SRTCSTMDTAAGRKNSRSEERGARIEEATGVRSSILDGSIVRGHELVARDAQDDDDEQQRAEHRQAGMECSVLPQGLVLAQLADVVVGLHRTEEYIGEIGRLGQHPVSHVREQGWMARYCWLGVSGPEGTIGCESDPGDRGRQAVRRWRLDDGQAGRSYRLALERHRQEGMMAVVHSPAHQPEHDGPEDTVDRFFF